jgi:hypothetical protein
MSFWTGFMFGFPTLLSYIVLALALQYRRVLGSHVSGSFGDLYTYSSVVSQFVGACAQFACMCGCPCAGGVKRWWVDRTGAARCVAGPNI